MIQTFAVPDQSIKVDLNLQTLALQAAHHGHIWRTMAVFSPFFEYLPLARRKPEDAFMRGNHTSPYFNGEKIEFFRAAWVEHRDFSSGIGRGVCSTFRGFQHAGEAIPFEFMTRIWLEDSNGALHFELIPLVEDSGVLRVAFPAPFELSSRSADCATVLPMMQGCLIPNDWNQDLYTFSAGYAYSRAAYMPWWGLLDHGAGCISIFDTPWDAGYRMEHPAGGPTLLHPLWNPSLGEVSYMRSLQMRFTAGADYTSLAKMYRAYARERGLLRTLREKAAEKPRVERLIGAPVIHTSIYYHIEPTSSYYNAGDPAANDLLVPFAERARQLRLLKHRGVENAYVHLDGWGTRGYDNLHPDVLPPCPQAGGWEGMRELVDTCHELGYLIIAHDQYRDYYKDAATYDPEQAVRNELGDIPSEAVWYGGEQAFLCATQAPAYVRRNYAKFRQGGVHLDGAYLDVFAVVELDECFHPEHRMTRRECMEARALSFAHLGTAGLVVSSEEPIDFAIPFLELVHHGPYALQETQDAGTARGIPIPLLNLVYHDCLILPWSLTTGGWGIPKEDNGLLHAYLNGGAGYLSIDAGAEEIERLRHLSAFQSRVAHAEMLRHEFIDGNLRRQRAVYSNGVTVEVDFEANSVKIIE